VYTLLVIDRKMFGGTMVLDFMDFAESASLPHRHVYCDTPVVFLLSTLRYGDLSYESTTI